MRRLLPLLCLLVLAAPATAQREPEWRASREVEVLVHPFAYAPRTILLRAGEPVRLRFLNQGQGTYSFSAEAFFRASDVRGGDAAAVQGGNVRLAPGERRVIALVPRAGRYSMRSPNMVHWALGMRGEIIVE